MYLGEASLKVELKDGIVTARRNDDGSILYQGTADDETWDTIIWAISHSCRDGHGPMIDRREA
tara:strand:- start:108 stop:296 length:189 start_codon:yes stop_codon:yes gene_type:complete